jgi:hypothetical protein
VNVLIATWFYADETKVTPTWIRCVLAFLASSIRWNPDCQHAFVTNMPNLPCVGGISIEEWLGRHAVTVMNPVPLTRGTPEAFGGSWRNQFYVFDVLESLAKRFPDAEGILLFESDCIWLGSHNRLTSAVAANRAAVYTLPCSPEDVVHEVRVADIMPIGRKLLGLETISGPSFYHADDLIACDQDTLQYLLHNVDRVFDQNIGEWSCGRPFLKEEAHFLSVLYGALGIAPNTANPIFRRIWTGPNYFDLLPSDVDLDIWHLPNERRLGLARLYRLALDENSWFWKARPNEFRRRAAHLVGITRRSSVEHLWAKTMDRVERVARREP